MPIAMPDTTVTPAAAEAARRARAATSRPYGVAVRAPDERRRRSPQQAQVARRRAAPPAGRAARAGPAGKRSEQPHTAPSPAAVRRSTAKSRRERRVAAALTSASPPQSSSSSSGSASSCGRPRRSRHSCSMRPASQRDQLRPPQAVGAGVDHAASPAAGVGAQDERRRRCAPGRRAGSVRQVGDRAGDAQHAVVAAGGERLRGRGARRGGGAPTGVTLGELAQHRRGHLRVAGRARAAQARGLRARAATTRVAHRRRGRRRRRRAGRRRSGARRAA